MLIANISAPFAATGEEITLEIRERKNREDEEPRRVTNPCKAATVTCSGLCSTGTTGASLTV